MAFDINKLKRIGARSCCNDGYPDEKDECPPGGCTDCMDLYPQWHLDQIKKEQNLSFDCEIAEEIVPNVKDLCNFTSSCSDCKAAVMKWAEQSPLKGIIKRVRADKNAQ